jgi:hypothetical protein
MSRHWPAHDAQTDETYFHIQSFPIVLDRSAPSKLVRRDLALGRALAPNPRVRAGTPELSSLIDS